MSEDELVRLIEFARAVRERAYAPYSGFAVGAVVETAEGRCYTGCNVENASYGLTICAERAALAKAVSEGADRLTRIVVIADTERPIAPCGACRQVMLELMGPEGQVIMANLRGDRLERKIGDLLPEAFAPHDLPARPR
ncbi:MAG: cytidine deaminase [Blastocatellia bacterium]